MLTCFSVPKQVVSHFFPELWHDKIYIALTGRQFSGLPLLPASSSTIGLYLYFIDWICTQWQAQSPACRRLHYYMTSTSFPWQLMPHGSAVCLGYAQHIRVAEWGKCGQFFRDLEHAIHRGLSRESSPSQVVMSPPGTSLTQRRWQIGSGTLGVLTELLYTPQAVKSNKENCIEYPHSSRQITFSKFYSHKGV